MMKRVKFHQENIAKMEKIQGNMGKIIAGNPIMKTLEDWDMSQSTTPIFKSFSKLGPLYELEIGSTA